MPKEALLRRLRKRSEFLRVARGSRVGRSAFSLQANEATGPEPGLGFTVTKQQGNSPERNRIRRRLREAIRRVEAVALRPHHDYVLVGRRAALTCDFDAMIDDLRSALQRLPRQASKRTRKPD
jgi:ribonuclease P protein component